MPVVTRSVTTEFAWPYYRMMFNDSAAPAHPEVDNHPGVVEQGRLVIDISNDCGIDMVGTVAADATEMWLGGASYLTIWRKYTDV